MRSYKRKAYFHPDHAIWDHPNAATVLYLYYGEEIELIKDIDGINWFRDVEIF